jgi:hypothetical protein
MAMNCGIDSWEFFQLLVCITRRQLHGLQEGNTDSGACIFNLQRISYALEELLPHLLTKDRSAEDTTFDTISSAADDKTVDAINTGCCAEPGVTIDVRHAAGCMKNCLLSQSEINAMLKKIWSVTRDYIDAFQHE